MTMEMGPSEVHVWSADLDQPSISRHSLEGYLSAYERARANRFRYKRDRERFMVGRGTLRALLACYAGVEPGRIDIEYGPNGRPYADLAVHFNVSHCGPLALFALSLEQAIGVDVEAVRPEPLEDLVAEHFFSAAEQRSLAAVAPSEQATAFFACWTRKEAYIKATGDGLSLPLESFDVTLAPYEQARLLRTARMHDDSAAWTIHDLSGIAPGYAAAVAVRRVPVDVRCFDVHALAGRELTAAG
jgi:4'-phosphopantetheinyl transferase